MSNPLLSILIPTVVGREEKVNQLRLSIMKQFGYAGTEVKQDGVKCEEWHYIEAAMMPVWIMICKDDKKLTIGEKREMMYQKSHGLYSWQIDDDDDISDNAIALILEAVKQNPDCITFEEYVNIDGKEYKSNHSLNYPGWVGDGNKELSDGYHFWRTPFFKSVIKTEIAKSVPIPHCRFGEDHQWSQALKPHLKTEVHIQEQIYRYIHVSTPHNERYGLDK